MTKLDEFVPVGEPIHPFDLYELIDKVPLASIEHIQDNPVAEDEADYANNYNKIGTIVMVDGKVYFQTTHVEPKTKAIV